MKLSLAFGPLSVHDVLAAGLLLLASSLGALSGGAFAAIGLGGGALLYLAQSYAARRPLSLPRVAVGFSTAALGLAMIACLTALDPGHSWGRVGQLALILLPMILLYACRPPTLPPLFGELLPYFFAVMLWIVLLELASSGHVLLLYGNKLEKYNRGLSYAAVWLFPLLGAMAPGWRAKAALTLVVFAACWFSPSRGALMAAGVGLTVAGLAWLSFRVTALLAGVVLALAAPAWPIIVQIVWRLTPDAIRALPTSWQHRFEIWDDIGARLLANPWMGHGLDATRSLTPDGPHQADYRFALGPASHPHHSFLQIWFDLGAGGLLLLLLLLLALLGGMARWPRERRALALGAWAAWVMLAWGSFSLWADSFLALGVLTLVWFRWQQAASLAASRN